MADTTTTVSGKGEKRKIIFLIIFIIVAIVVCRFCGGWITGSISARTMRISIRFE